MNLVKWDPFRELEEVSSRLNRLFGQRSPAREDTPLFADWAPAIDVQETEKEFLVKADLPDVKKEDVTVEVVDGTLNVRGERHREKEEKGKRFHRVERGYGRFERRLTVPAGIDAEKIAADFKDGVLNVHLPKSAEAKPKTIDVKVA